MNFKMNNDTNSKLIRDDKRIYEFKSKFYHNSLVKSISVYDEDSLINQSKINRNKKITNYDNSNNNSNNTAIFVKDKLKTLSKSVSMELLENKKLKISQSLLNLINKEDKFKTNDKKRTFERTENLYQKRFKRNETLKFLKKELDDYRIIYEMEDCTFKPNINPDKVKRDKSQNNLNNENMSFYERVKIWKKKKLEKSDNEKKLYKKREFAKCTFHPIIISSVPVYNEINSYDEGTIKYLDRVHKARGEKLLLKNKLNHSNNTK